MESSRLPGQKFLATYHPAAVIRLYQHRPIAVFDLAKALKEIGTRNIKRKFRQILVPETIEECKQIARKLKNSPEITVDTETKGNWITCIGFSVTEDKSYVIPLYDERQKDGLYWRTKEENLEALKIIEEICTRPATKILQNGSYDVQRLSLIHI